MKLWERPLGNGGEGKAGGGGGGDGRPIQMLTDPTVRTFKLSTT